MKNFYFLLIGLLLLGNLSWANKTTSILKADLAPTIDGTIDPMWNLAPAEKLDFLANAGTGDPTVAASWRAMWDATNIYLLFEVKDDVLLNNGTANDVWYIHDCIEMFTDMKNLKNDAEVTNSEGQYQLRFIYGLDNEPLFENPTMTGYQTVSKINDAGDGYVIEVKFPWDLLTANTAVVIAEGLKIGIDFKVTDVDVATTGDWWPAHFEYAWNNTGGKKPINFGSIVLVKDLPEGTPIAKASSVITIDGIADESSWNTAAYVLARIDTWAPNYEIKGRSDFSANFKGLWDDTNLYLAFDVTDDVVTQGAGDVDNKWVTDCIEVIFAKDATTNYKYRFAYGSDNQSVISGTEIEVPTGFKNVTVKTATGYTIEASIPWTSIPEIKEAVQRSTKFSISFGGTDIDKVDAAQWTDVSGVIGWPYSPLSNVVFLAFANEVDIDTQAPAAPASLTGVAPDYKSLNLSWNAPADNDVLLYTVMINNNLVATTNELTYNASGLLPSTVYTCQIFANDAQNYSVGSNSIEITTKEEPQLVVRTVGIEKIDFDPSENYEYWDGITPAALFNPDKTYDAADLSAGWKALWDTDNLYLQINVKDADIYNSSPNGWENDNIELFFDMNGERDGTSCESLADADNWQIDNFQYRFIAYDKVTQTGSQNAPIWTGVEVSYFDIISGGNKLGYTCEIIIPWTSLTSAKSDEITFKPELNSEFAFEVQVTDVDPFVNDKDETVYNNGDANGVMHWNLQDNAISSNRNNSQYGKVFLSLTQQPFTGILDKAIYDNSLKVYPNPVSGKLTVEIPSAGFTSMVFTDVTGKTVLQKAIKNIGGNETVDVSHLSKGIYFIALRSTNKILMTKVVVK